MPHYLTHKDNTFYFRQSVPQELRPIVGKREIKKSLGHDYFRAVSECKRYAVIADLLIAEARVKLDAVPSDPYSREGIRRTQHVPLTGVTPALELEFADTLIRKFGIEQAEIVSTEVAKDFDWADAFHAYGSRKNSAKSCPKWFQVISTGVANFTDTIVRLHYDVAHGYGVGFSGDRVDTLFAQ
jgi:hypothetical protein